MKQYNEQFPNGVKDAPCDFDFSPLVAAITNDMVANHQPNAKTEEELKKFRDYFTPKATDVKIYGKHFNMQNLIKAFEIYNNNYTSWSGDQLSLFWRQVIGYLQRLVPACYAQAFCQGLYHVVEEKKPLERSFKLDNAVYYPLDRDPKFQLGKYFGVFSYRWAYVVVAGTWVGGRADLQMSGWLKNHVEQKQQSLSNLKPICNIQKTSKHSS
ncbi:MAG: hypothetical protein ACD_46C00484G0014 [uncultured bacterium]|nr:MAG: hypothetical protein ACD_46C00484G0014 [uncultured bacterium]